ncbi:MAG: hybrid sensor histidine kinase/response regulator, partial [Chloroflexota bacterium]
VYQIHHNSKHLLAMIDDVLDLSQAELSEFSLNFESTDLHHFLHDTVQMLRPQFSDSAIRLETHIPENLPIVDIDRTRMRQVFINLITNARRFTDKGYVRFHAHLSDTSIKFSIEDTGRGIKPENLSLIFEEFYQVDYSLSRQHGGAGLGLTITKQFVEAHNGTLTVKSTYGEGSIFIVKLPRPERQRNLSARDIEIPKTVQNNIIPETALIVGADASNLSLLSRRLAPIQLVPIDHPDNLAAGIFEHDPIAIIHNRLPHQPTLPASTIPIIECSLPGTQWLHTNVDVAHSLAKPILPQQIVDMLAMYPEAQKLLIVDDDMGFVQLIQRSIEGTRQPYHVRRAYDGKQAYSIIQDDPPDLIFLDIAMPEMSGLDLLDHLQNNTTRSTITIILLTATRYLQSDDEWMSPIRIYKQDGINMRQRVHYLRAILDANSKRMSQL